MPLTFLVRWPIVALNSTCQNKIYLLLPKQISPLIFLFLTLFCPYYFHLPFSVNLTFTALSFSPFHLVSCPATHQINLMCAHQAAPCPDSHPHCCQSNNLRTSHRPMYMVPHNLWEQGQVLQLMLSVIFRTDEMFPGAMQ